MREISFVKRIKFNFDGSVTKRALVIGDADNDRRNELVCANLQGDMAIFKGDKPTNYAYANNLGMVTACLIGDLMNSGKNNVAVINMEGWLFIFEVISKGLSERTKCDKTDCSGEANTCEHIINKPIELNPVYEQRMPANCKDLLIADLDGDGQNEIIIGLTDRVLRTYKWVKIGPERGKFVGLYKWEFADQIGSVSLNPSRHENCQDIIVAQPGGTYAKLECFDKKPQTTSTSTSGSLNEQKFEELHQGRLHQHQLLDSSTDDDNVKTEYISKLTPEYHQLALAQMRNHHVSTEVLGGIKDGKNSQSYSLIVIATLDGTLMLVNKDETLWSLQVDHQLFALANLDVMPENEYRTKFNTQSGSASITISDHRDEELSHQHQPVESNAQYFVACAWNGKTYMIDEERNYLRFKFGEAVSAFTAGNYFFDERHHASLVYATFNNQIILYYDVLLDSVRPVYLLKEIMSNPDYEDIRLDLERLSRRLELSNANLQDPESIKDSASRNSDLSTKLYDTLHEVLYNFEMGELSAAEERVH